MKELIARILNKKELGNLPENIVKEKIEKYANNKFKEKYSKLGTRFFRTKEFKELKKKVRSELREIYGVFIEPKKNREKLLSALLKNPSIDAHMKMLEIHKSSKERIPFYDLVYRKIFDVTGKPAVILDLASGYNAFSYPFMGMNAFLISVDLSEKDAAFVQKYFNSQEIKGKAIALDLTKPESLEVIKKLKADVCFLFKALDSIETVKRNWSKQLLEAINAKYIVISFPTKSLGGKKDIKTAKRNWIEKNYTIHTKFEVPNEIFYILKWKG